MKKQTILLTLLLSTNLFANSGPISEIHKSWEKFRQDFKSAGLNSSDKARIARKVISSQLDGIEKEVTDDSQGDSFEIQQTFEGVDLITDNIDGEAGIEMLENLEERSPEMCAALADHKGKNIKDEMISKYVFINPDSAPAATRIINQYLQAFKISCENTLKLEKMIKGQKAEALSCGAEVNIPLVIHANSLAGDTEIAKQELSKVFSENKLKPKFFEDENQLLADIKNRTRHIAIKLSEIKAENSQLTIQSLALQLMATLNANKFLCDNQDSLVPVNEAIFNSEPKSEIETNKVEEEVESSSDPVEAAQQ